MSAYMPDSYVQIDTATEQENAQESAAQDSAMGATQDSEEGSTEG